MPVAISRRSKGEEASYILATVDRAVGVLEVFSRAKPELTLNEVALASGLHKSTALRFLATLRSRGLVNKDEDTNRYRLGWALIGLAEIAKTRSGLVAEALPTMRRIREALNETVFLSVRVGDMRADLEQLESTRDVRRVIALGEQKPLYTGCGSKALLAAMADDEIEDYIARTTFTAITSRTITDPRALREEIAKIRRQGYAESRDERNSGGAGASAPVYDASERVVASLTVSVPINRFTEEVRRKAIDQVVEGARAVSAQLGSGRAGRIAHAR